MQKSGLVLSPNESPKTLLRPMEFPIEFDTVKSRWSIVYIEGSNVKFAKNIVLLSLQIVFVLANSADPT